MSNSNYSNSSEFFFDELLRISGSIVWKNPTLALQNENEDYSIEVEQYILARQGRLNFDTIYEFSEGVLRQLTISEEDIINYQDNPSLIPQRIRNKVVEMQVEWTLEHYEEKNNYYRMLNGLPDLEDKDFFYNTEYPDISDNITPLHKLNSSAIRLLEANGYIDKIVKNNPTKKYLKHLTDKKIDIYKARNSKEFSILWITSSDSDNMVEDFMDTYNEARGMIMAVFYQRMMSQSNSEYTGFIGMMILFQTIMLMQKNFLDADISRDFYDVESLRLVYDSYDVPFYQNIPLEYHKKIVKNINILLSHKGSTRVFYDLFDIFGFNDIAMYSFYMMKTRRMTRDGKPITVIDENGNVDRQKMYEINFAKVPLYGDPLIELRNPRNKVRYHELIANDQYWIDDKDLLDKIFNEEFNYMESKYLGIQLTSNLMQILYETTYYLKMILDNRQMLAATTIYNSALHANMNLFDMVIYLSALITKKYGYEGNIPHDPHEIGSVMGFNFKLDLENLKKNIKDDPYLKKDKKLYTLLETMDVNNLASVKRVYTNLNALRKYLVKKMSETDKPDEYWSYYNLHKTIMYSEYTEETFMKSTGDVALTFADLLSDINPALYGRYETLSNDELNNEVVNMLYLAKSSCNALKYIQYADSVNINVLIEYLFKLLDFFKSAKADLTGYEVIYSLISNADNILKLMCCIDRIYDDYTDQPIYSIFDDLTSMIAWIEDRMNLRDKYKLIDEMPYEFHTSVVKSIIEYLDDYVLKCTEVFYNFIDSTQFIDWIGDHKDITILPDDPFNVKDTMFVVYEELKEILKFKVFDEFPILDKILIEIDRIKDIDLNEKISFMCKLSTMYEMSDIGESSRTLTDDLISSSSKEEFVTENMLIDEIIRIFKDHNKTTVNITTKDFLKYINERMPLNDMDYGFKDMDPTLQEIFLILEDFNNNRIRYMDELEAVFFKYYFGDSYTLKDEVEIKEFCDSIFSNMPYLFAYIKDHKEISFLSDKHTIQDDMFTVFSEIRDTLIKINIMTRFPWDSSIYSIYQKYHPIKTTYHMDSDMVEIRSIDMVLFKNQKMDSIIHEERDIMCIVKDIKENSYTYASEYAINYMKHFVNVEYPIHDDLSVREIFMGYKTIMPLMSDNIKSIKNKTKLPASNIGWGEKLYLVYEETFED